MSSTVHTPKPTHPTAPMELNTPKILSPTKRQSSSKSKAHNVSAKKSHKPQKTHNPDHIPTKRDRAGAYATLILDQAPLFAQDVDMAMNTEQKKPEEGSPRLSPSSTPSPPSFHELPNNSISNQPKQLSLPQRYREGFQQQQQNQSSQLEKQIEQLEDMNRSTDRSFDGLLHQLATLTQSLSKLNSHPNTRQIEPILEQLVEEQEKTAILMEELHQLESEEPDSEAERLVEELEQVRQEVQKLGKDNEELSIELETLDFTHKEKLVQLAGFRDKLVAEKSICDALDQNLGSTYDSVNEED
ncbi:hypothetical protein BLNAU_194 [Blattamonas nauphoetae]|uniref:Mediator of RNA polymerase II transcription subunit 21 n=1 Tax=Blattamonas nauphoetae TaxID=2049346 RepID=A0ABQ9YMA3_9EUKA|nr:hypothetical protein BLNAU_194 [Blattamonas nauphoetae]